MECKEWASKLKAPTQRVYNQINLSTLYICQGSSCIKKRVCRDYTFSSGTLRDFSWRAHEQNWHLMTKSRVFIVSAERHLQKVTLRSVSSMDFLVIIRPTHIRSTASRPCIHHHPLIARTKPWQSPIILPTCLCDPLDHATSIHLPICIVTRHNYEPWGNSELIKQHS